MIVPSLIVIKESKYILGLDQSIAVSNGTMISIREKYVEEFSIMLNPSKLLCYDM